MDITIIPRLTYSEKLLSFKGDDSKKNSSNRTGNNGSAERKNPIDRQMEQMQDPGYGYGGCCVPALIALSASTALGLAAKNYIPQSTVQETPQKEIQSEECTNCYVQVFDHGDADSSKDLFIINPFEESESDLSTQDGIIPIANFTNQQEDS